ncbi:MAG: type II secretion system F family protein [Candidatus Bathyarchaeia archaeon]|jgi:flagellar protein FlaJ
MSKPAKINSKDSKKDFSVLREPWLLAFRYLNAQLPKVMPYFQDLGPSLQKAGVKISLQGYVSLTLFVTGLSFFTTFGVTFAIAGVLGVPILITLLFAFGVGTLSGAATFGLIYGFPSFLATNRRKRMDLELPYVASHLSILATAGLPPARMFKLLEDSATTPQVASEANEVTRDVEVLGEDIITALEAERVRSPSKTFAEILEGFVATIRSGGNLTGYLQDATRVVMDLRRVAAKQLVESLATFAEVYVTLMVVFPLLVIVMFSVMSIIGGGLGGFSTSAMMTVVTYLIIPASGLAVIVMLDTMLVED